MSHTVSFRLEGVPPNWSNVRWGQGHDFERQSDVWRAKADWKTLTHAVAMSTRHRSWIPAPARSDPRRRVLITLYRRRLLDVDGAWSSVKPIIDGLKGALLFDDAQKYIEPFVHQLYPEDQPESLGRECVVVAVEVHDSAEKSLETPAPVEQVSG